MARIFGLASDSLALARALAHARHTLIILGCFVLVVARRFVRFFWMRAVAGVLIALPGIVARIYGCARDSLALALDSLISADV